MNSSIVNEAFSFIVFVLIQTITQVVVFFGSIIIFGLLLYIFSSLTRRVYANTVGAKAEIYITGFIGTPIHELSHALFCIIFNHKINEIKLFSPKANNGSLGYVVHSYDKRNWYAQAGNFFIGVAPIVMGSLIIYFLLSIILPSIKEQIFYFEESNNLFLLGDSDGIKNILVSSLSSIVKLFTSTLENIKAILLALVSDGSVKTVQFWIFIFISISIASHIELSPADILHALKGMVYILCLLLILNAIMYFIILLTDNKMIVSIKDYLFNFFNIFIIKSKTIFLVALLFSIANFLITYIILTPISLIKYKRFIKLHV